MYIFCLFTLDLTSLYFRLRLLVCIVKWHNAQRIMKWKEYEISCAQSNLGTGPACEWRKLVKQQKKKTPSTKKRLYRLRFEPGTFHVHVRNITAWAELFDVWITDLRASKEKIVNKQRQQKILVLECWHFLIGNAADRTTNMYE
jgi:hypothetical protein